MWRVQGLSGSTCLYYRQTGRSINKQRKRGRFLRKKVSVVLRYSVKPQRFAGTVSFSGRCTLEVSCPMDTRADRKTSQGRDTVIYISLKISFFCEWWTMGKCRDGRWATPGGWGWMGRAMKERGIAGLMLKYIRKYCNIGIDTPAALREDRSCWHTSHNLTASRYAQALGGLLEPVLVLQERELRSRLESLPFQSAQTMKGTVWKSLCTSHRSAWCFTPTQLPLNIPAQKADKSPRPLLARPPSIIPLSPLSF